MFNRLALVAIFLAAHGLLWAPECSAKNARVKPGKSVASSSAKPADPAKEDKSQKEEPAPPPSPASALAEEDQEDKNAPLQITSQRMVSEKKSNKISFYGSVVAVKGKLRVEADEMHVFPDDSQKHLKEMEAIGSVVITHKDKTATGKKAVYYDDSQTLILTGDPALKQGKNVAKGEKVIYRFGDEDMEIISGDNQPASITLFPKEEGK